jgi:hypothetical protein
LSAFKALRSVIYCDCILRTLLAKVITVAISLLVVKAVMKGLKYIKGLEEKE